MKLFGVIQGLQKRQEILSENTMLCKNNEKRIFNTEACGISYKKSTAYSGKSSFTGNTPEEKIKELDARGKFVEDWCGQILLVLGILIMKSLIMRNKNHKSY